MRPTIRDVARQANVSIATVSRVMHDHANVSVATRDRVNAAVTDLEFIPSRLGRSLAERRHAANGIVFPDLSGPYYAEVVLGYESVAAELGRSVLILSTHGRSAAPAMVEEMADRCDGLVIMGRTVPDEVVERLARRIPVVLLARPQIGEVDSVKADNVAGAHTLIEHVIASGARRIVLVGDPDLSPDVAERWDGFETAASKHGGIQLTQRHPARFGELAGEKVAREAMSQGLPDAFVCANDELALGVLSELRSHDVDVPGRVKLTGWDDIMAARYAGLTTVRQPMRDLGGMAARLLDEIITGTRNQPRHEVLPTELVVRASSGLSRKEQR
ncbi:MAG TPA: LacI family DNA-binding transcriptional regulator [Nocardioidaceae bacterium]|nr:LacI family DNA-binding transcriptional regulator [Nocardioidaceae bacterium]